LGGLGSFGRADAGTKKKKKKKKKDSAIYQQEGERREFWCGRKGKLKTLQKKGVRKEAKDTPAHGSIRIKKKHGLNISMPQREGLGWVGVFDFGGGGLWSQTSWEREKRTKNWPQKEYSQGPGRPGWGKKGERGGGKKFLGN